MEDINPCAAFCTAVSFVVGIILIFVTIASYQVVTLILGIVFIVISILLCCCLSRKADKIDKARNEIEKKKPAYNNLRY